MGSIIIAMPKAEDAERIGDMLKRSGMDDNIFYAKTGSQVLSDIRDKDVDLIICTRKLSDMSYEEIVEYMPSYVNLILLTKDSSLYSYSSNVVRLLMPFRTGDLINTIGMFRGPMRLKKKKPPTARSEEEKTIIAKAKQVLMERNNMSEPDAFRYIQKNSMDSGRSMVESAQMILVLNSE